ncbi:acyltransferase [Klebsiella pneumoniae]|uniref:acyltransferase family protein n=1 Tax=Klebsiella pneumoniae TaxID=573 RepID=UPI00164C0C6F|nr:acyltransferase [Klebsiella pneumoniae]UZL16426.1 acyltransferase [Klebsiella pneumoniae]CAH5982942.1 O-acetyltransferase OatA [Klebsiella pneumoniae]HDS8216077.1 acyltransferase [Klebsiella pneumoniae subsp. pneumoniae]HDT4834500.1 acyltransferase [Klebsiella pneumoniae subsp. pneumoniae]
MINNIQILRAIAVLMVIGCHSSGLVYKYGFDFNGFIKVGRWGAFGVDIFFVISGYIMAMIDSTKHKTPLEFIKDRAARIIPTYWICTLLLIGMQTFLPWLFNGSIQPLEQNIASLLFISNFFGYTYPTIYVGWSLEFEAFFYVVFALCLFIKDSLFKTILLMVVIFLSSLFGIIKPIAIEFCYGVLIYHLVSRYRLSSKLNARYFILAILVSLYIMSLSLIVPVDIIPTWRRPLIVGVVSFFLVLSSVVCRDFKKGILTYIGDASYSMYLIQVFSLPLIIKMSSKFLPNVDGLLIFFLCALFTVACGIVFYEVVEKNIINIIRKRKLSFFKLI